MANEELPSMSELVAMRQKAERRHKLHTSIIIGALMLVFGAVIALIIVLLTL